MEDETKLIELQGSIINCKYIEEIKYGGKEMFRGYTLYIRYNSGTQIVYKFDKEEYVLDTIELISELMNEA